MVKKIGGKRMNLSRTVGTGVERENIWGTKILKGISLWGDGEKGRTLRFLWTPTRKKEKRNSLL